MSFNETRIIKKCRKDHKCGQCYQSIPKGSSYTNHYGVWEGDFFSAKYHNECMKLWCKFNSESDDDCWYDIGEHMSYVDKSPGSLSFKDYQAEIRRRYNGNDNSNSTIVPA